MPITEFHALEYRADQTFAEATYRFEGDTEQGFRVLRNGHPRLELGPGYQLLRSVLCGVCSTDLERHLMPFPPCPHPGALREFWLSNQGERAGR